MQMKSVTALLTYAGTFPFIICVILLHYGVEALPLLGRVDLILSTYALVILSFMAGVHWGQHLGQNDLWSRLLPLMSNAITLAGWFGFLLLKSGEFAILCSIGFAALLWIDLRLWQSGYLSLKYITLRRNVTVIVIGSLITSVFVV
jgi:hypothetical protein